MSWPNETGYDPMFDNRNPRIEHAAVNDMIPREPLDIKDQHLVSLSQRYGYLMGRNSILENDNASLKRRVDEQERLIKDGTAENKRQRESLDEWRDKYWEADRERNRLRQYEPKDEPQEGVS